MRGYLLDVGSHDGDDRHIYPEGDCRLGCDDMCLLEICGGLGSTSRLHIQSSTEVGKFASKLRGAT